MKHNVKVTLILIIMFFVTQLIGLAVINAYTPEQVNLPYGMQPPEINATPGLFSILVSIIIAVSIVFLLMKLRADVVLRYWFFFVVVVAIGITLNALFFNLKVSSASLISVLIALPLAYIKVFKRKIIVHNFTELLIYPGISAVFVPILNIWTIVVLLILISIYDIYAVWHAGFMQKMAKYQIEKLKFFTGFFVPYLGKKQRLKLKNMKKLEKKGKKSGKKGKKIKVNLAILGGGDVVFPIIMAGVVLRVWGIVPALTISIGATIALGFLFLFSTKGKFYPAMPFITAGCLVGLGIARIFFV